LRYRPGFSKLLVDPPLHWRFQSEPEETHGNRRISIPRGSLALTLINGMIYFFAWAATDYDGGRNRAPAGASTMYAYFRS